MLHYPPSDLYAVVSMKEILSVILRGCEQARDLEANLLRMASQPQLLMNSCKAIAADFNDAVGRLSSKQHAVFGEASASGRHLVGTAGDEDSLGSDLITAMDLLNTKAMEGESPFFPRALSESDVGGLSELPELGLEIQTTSAPGLLEFGASSGGHVGSAGLDHLTGGSRQEPVDMVASGSARRPAGLSVQRTTRKRKGSDNTWTRRVPALRTGNLEIPPDDGYTWRKYGQKDILGARFPRSYYRCTHKNFYGCEAKKQVQRLDDDPYTYEVTYCGHHSCRTSPTPYPIMANTAAPVSEAGSSALAQLPPSLSVSMQLGSWFSAGLESQKDEKSHGGLHIGGESKTARTVSPLVRGGRDAECPVADLADVMFNSRNNASSMDAIFPSKQHN